MISWFCLLRFWSTVLHCGAGMPLHTLNSVYRYRYTIGILMRLLPGCRTSQLSRTMIPFSVSLGNDLADPVFDGVGLASFKSVSIYVLIGLSCWLPFCLLQFSLSRLSFYGLVLCGLGFGQIGCKSHSPSFALPTFFISNSNESLVYLSNKGNYFHMLTMPQVDCSEGCLDGNDAAADDDENSNGPHLYKLASIVSHFGLNTTTGTQLMLSIETKKMYFIMCSPVTKIPVS